MIMFPPLPPECPACKCLLIPQTVGGLECVTCRMRVGGPDTRPCSGKCAYCTGEASIIEQEFCNCSCEVHYVAGVL